MSKLEQFKETLFGLGFREKKKNFISKVYSKEFDGEKVQLAMLYKVTPKKIKFYMVDSVGRGNLQLVVDISKLKFDEDGALDQTSWKEYKGKEKAKIYDFNKL